MNRIAIIATVIILFHLVVAMLHGQAHEQLRVAWSRGKTRSWGS